MKSARTGFAAILFAGVLAAAGATPAFAATDTFTWNGTCFDCVVAPSPAQALITLESYTSGDVITAINFVSLEYHSANFDLMFLKDAAVTATGSLPGAVLTGPAMADLFFDNMTDASGIGLWSFLARSDGTWDLALNGVSQDRHRGDEDGNYRHHDADEHHGFRHGEHRDDRIHSVVHYDDDYSHVSSVPEPETYALFLAGLGLMGFIARRRKNGQT